MTAHSCPKALRLALLLLFLLSPRISLAQLSTGTVAGKLRDEDGQPVKAAAIVVSSELGFRAAVKTDPEGTFLLTLPYGNYQLSVEEGRSTAPSSVSIRACQFRWNHCKILRSLCASPLQGNLRSERNP